MAPETAVDEAVERLVLRAPSMRPGQDGPGNIGYPTQKPLALLPSMRPGQDGPGNRP